MKFNIFNNKREKYIKEDEDNVIDIRVILYTPPTAPNEAANKGYLDQKINDLDAGDFTGVLNHKNVPDFKGPDIVTPDRETLELKEILKSDTIMGAMVQVDEYGRVLAVHKIEDKDLSPDIKFKWGDITSKPETLEGYGITDLIRSDHPDRVNGNTTVENYQGKDSKSPVPIEFLQEKIQEYKDLQIKTGDSIIKLDGASTVGYYLQNGATITKEKDPDLVLAITGDPKATTAKLKDSTKDDEERFYRAGVKARTYVKR